MTHRKFDRKRDYEIKNPAKQKVDGVNDGVRLLQRRIYQYVPAINAASIHSGGGAGNYPTKYRYTSTNVSPGFIPFDSFFVMHFTPSSDNTAIRWKCRYHTTLSNSDASVTALMGVNVYIIDSPTSGRTNEVPNYGWSASGTGSPEFWWNSWGKDRLAKIEFKIHNASHNNPQVPDGDMWVNAPMMIMEEWENGNPNGPQVEYWTGARDIGGGMSGVNKPQPHLYNNYLSDGTHYAKDPARWDGGYVYQQGQGPQFTDEEIKRMANNEEGEV
jgi:hypothetical protein